MCCSNWLLWRPTHGVWGNLMFPVFLTVHRGTPYHEPRGSPPVPHPTDHQPSLPPSAIPHHRTWDQTVVAPHPDLRLDRGYPPSEHGILDWGYSPLDLALNKGLPSPPPPTPAPDLGLDRGDPPHWTWDWTGGLLPYWNSMNSTEWAVHLWRSHWRSFLFY